MLYWKKKNFSYGIINSVDKNNIRFLINSDARERSSCSPIINSNQKVLGIHNGLKGKVKAGAFIEAIINELIKEENIEKIKEYKSNENNYKENNSKEENDEIKSAD